MLRVTDSVKKQICQRFVHLTKNFRRKKIHGNSENMSVEVRAELTSFHESRMVFMNIFSYGTVFLFPIPLSLPLSYPVWYPPSLTFPTHFPHHSITSPPSLTPPSPLPHPSLTLPPPSPRRYVGWNHCAGRPESGCFVRPTIFAARPTQNGDWYSRWS